MGIRFSGMRPEYISIEGTVATTGGIRFQCHYHFTRYLFLFVLCVIEEQLYTDPNYYYYLENVVNICYTVKFVSASLAFSTFASAS